jgi:hypothetical protein
VRPFTEVRDRSVYLEQNQIQEPAMTLIDYILSPIDAFTSSDNTAVFLGGWAALLSGIMLATYLVWSYIGGLFASALMIHA